MYSLEYKMLLQVLHQLGASGEFQADIPPQAMLRDGGYVVLHVQNGDVVSCFISNKNGKKWYYDAEVQYLLLKFGILDWQLVSSASPETATSISSPAVSEAKPVERNENFVPQRCMVSPTRMHDWSILERSVYSLADGTRTIEQMAKLLSRPNQTIEQVIHDFEISGVIEWHYR